MDVQLGFTGNRSGLPQVVATVSQHICNSSLGSCTSKGQCRPVNSVAVSLQTVATRDIPWRRISVTNPASLWLVGHPETDDGLLGNQLSGAVSASAQRPTAKRVINGSAVRPEPPLGQNDCEKRASRNSPSLAVALNCGMGSSSLRAEVKALERLQIVRGWNSSYLGSK
jgi:hypothetical protein